MEPDTAITSSGLKWPLNKMRPTRWWQATLNEATSTSVTLDFTPDKPLVIYRALEP